MKLFSSPALGFVCMTSVFAMDAKFDCKDIAAAGLFDALFFGAAVAVATDAAQNANPAPGVPGEQGEQGEQGAPGVPGAQGPQGEQGIQGEQGVQGEQGLQGERGADGANGADGAQGAQGIQGEQGIQGVQGEQGPAGATGADGAPGAPGADGTPGVDGIDTGNVLSSGYVNENGVLSEQNDTAQTTDVTRLNTGIYEMTIDLTSIPLEDRPQTPADVGVLIQLEAFAGDVFGDFVVAALRWPFYQSFINTDLNGDPVEVRLLIQVRQLESGSATVDNPFTFAVMGV